MLKIISRLMTWTSVWMVVPPNEKRYAGRIAGYVEMSEV